MIQNTDKGNEVVEGNKFIAKFMGGNIIEIDDNTCFDFGNKHKKWNRLSISELKYHSSWDWLMPACKKWDSLFEGKKIAAKRYSVYEELSDKLDVAVTLYEIQEVFYQLAGNIKCLNSQKWYNTKK